MFGSVELDRTFVLNVLATVVFAVLFGLTVRRGATDPMCGMKVDRAKAMRLEHDGHTDVLLLSALPQRLRGPARPHPVNRGTGRTRASADAVFEPVTGSNVDVFTAAVLR